MGDSGLPLQHAGEVDQIHTEMDFSKKELLQVNFYNLVLDEMMQCRNIASLLSAS